jgi:hypothetical protein
MLTSVVSGASAPEAGAPDNPRETLARRLHWEMERLEPTSDAEWTNLTEHQRDFYRYCVDGLLEEDEALLSVFRSLPTTT